MNFLANIALNLRATGPAAVMITWLIAVAVLGVFGSDHLAGKGMTLLAFFGGAVMIGLASKV
jgi:hypothetical protein